MRIKVIVAAGALLAIVYIIFANDERGDSFTCNVERVTDGDTFRCDDGTRVRVQGIDAPEIDTRQGPPSRDALTAIIADRSLNCERKGESYDRIVATCFLDGQDIAALMVQQAQARDCPRHSGGAYAQYEDARHGSLPIGDFCAP